MSQQRIYDVSLTLCPEMVTWPGDPAVVIEPVNRIAAGASSNVTRLQLGTHSGTHVDAPRHFIEGAPAVDSIPAEVLIGPARLFQLPDVETIDRAVLESVNLEGVSRVLFGTRNASLLDQPYTTDYVSVSGDGAQYLVDRQIQLVGIDYLSVEQYKKPGYPTHNALLRAGVVVVEGLDLRDVPAGDYEIICLPLKVRDADGAPARVLLRAVADE